MKGFFRIRFLLIVLAVLSLSRFYSQLSGTFNIPTNYPNLGAAITDLNNQGINGPVLITVNAGHSETVTPGGYTLTASGNSVNPIVFQKSGLGANPLLVAYNGGIRTPGSAIQDGIWHFVGCDYVTVDGIDLLDLNPGNPATMEYGFGFFKANAADGCQHNTIQNCNITLNRVNNASGSGPAADGSRGINVVNSLIGSQTTALTITSSAGSHSHNRFYANTIQNCNIGISLIGFAAPAPFLLADNNNEIGGTGLATGNSILNYGGGATTSPAAAIRTLAQYNLVVAYNTINNNSGSGINHGTTLRGIYLNTAQSANVSVHHNTITVHGAGTVSQISAIENLAGATAASNSVIIEHNLITACTNSNNLGGAFYGIYNNGASCEMLSISSNTLFQNNLLSANGSVFLIYNNATVNGWVRFANNLIGDNTFISSTSGIHYFLYNNATSAANVQMSDNSIVNNLRTAGTGATYGLFNSQTVGGAVTLTNNLVSGNTFSLSGGALYGIYNAGASGNSISISQNTYSNNSTNSTSGALYPIYNTGSTLGILLLDGNFISSEITQFTGNGTFYGLYNNSASSPSLSISNNQFQALQVSVTSGSVHLIYNRGPLSTTFSANAIEYNSVSSCTVSSSSGPFLGIYNSLVNSASLSISHNSLTNIHLASASASKYLLFNNGLTGSTISMEDNLISACTNTLNTTGLFYGINNSGNCNGDLRIQNNFIQSVNSTAISGASALIYNMASVLGARSFTGNTITNCNFSASGSGEFNAIYNFGNNGLVVDLSANTISGLNVTRASGAAYLIQNAGPVASSIGTVNIIGNNVNNLNTLHSGNGAFFAFYNNLVSAQELNILTNTLVGSTNTSSNGATYLFYNRGGSTATFVTNALSNNSVSNYSFSSNGNGSFFGVYNNGASALNLSLSSNTFSALLFNSSVNARYILMNSSVASGSLQMNLNRCSGLTSTLNTSGVFYFLNNTSTASLGIESTLNEFSNSQLRSSTGNIFCLTNSGNSGNAVLFEQNLIQNLSVQQSASGSLYGIYNNAASCSTLSVSQNTLSQFDLSYVNGAQYWLFSGGNALTTISSCKLEANTISNFTCNSTSTGATYGLYNGGATLNELSILNNTVNAVNWNTINTNKYLILNTSVVNFSTNIRQNSLSDLYSGTNNTADFFGIRNNVPASASEVLISENTLENVVLNNSNGDVQFIQTTGTLTGGVDIRSNNIRQYTVQVSGSANVYGVNNSVAGSSLISIRQNSLSQANITYSNGGAYEILNTAASSGSVLLAFNRLMDITTTANGGGGRYLVYNNSASASVLSINSNSLSGLQHNTLNGNVHFLYNRGNLSNGFNGVDISDNSISQCTITSNPTLTQQNYVVYNNGVLCNNVSIQSNTISQINWQTTLAGRYLIYNTASATDVQIRDNVLQQHTALLNTSGFFYGIYNNSSSTANLQLNNNVIDQIQSMSTTGRKFMILNTGAISGFVSMVSNTITNNSFQSTLAASFFALRNQASVSDSLYIRFNTIHSNSASTSNGTLALISNYGSTTVSINRILVGSNRLTGNAFSASLNGPLYGILNESVQSEYLSLDSNSILNLQGNNSSGHRFVVCNTGSVANTISISHNTLNAVTFTNGTTGSFYGLFNNAACNGLMQITGNQLQQIYLASTSGTNFAIYNSGGGSSIRRVDANRLANVNSISSTSGTYFGIFNLSSGSQSLSISSNTLDAQIIRSYSVPIRMIFNTGAPSVTLSTIGISNNQISGGIQETDSLGSFFGICNNAINAQTIGINNNSILNHSLDVQQGARYLLLNNATAVSALAINNNTINGGWYPDSLSAEFYGIKNEGEVFGVTQINNNTFSNTVVSTKSSSVFLMVNAPSGTSTSVLAEMNGNTVQSNSIRILQNKPFHVLFQAGSQVSDLTLNGNTISSNTMDIVAGQVVLLKNGASVTNSLSIQSNLFATNTNSAGATGDFFAINQAGPLTGSASMLSNTISNNRSYNIGGNTNLIFQDGGIASMLDISNNSLNHEFSHPLQPYTGEWNGIWVLQSGLGASVNVSANVFSSISFSTATGLGPLYFIRNSSDPLELDVSNNSFSNLLLRNSGAHHFIYNSGSVQSLLNVVANSLVNYVRQQAGTGDFSFYFSNSSNVPATCVQNFSNNLVSQVSSSVTGAGSFYGIFSADGGLGSFPLKSIHHNTVSSIAVNGVGDCIALYANYLGNGGSALSSSIHDNKISTLSVAGYLFGIFHGVNTSPTQPVEIYANDLGDFISSGASSVVYPLCLNFANRIRASKNKIYSISGTGISARAYGIYVGQAGLTEINNNRVGGISAPNSLVSDPVNGISVAGGATVQLNYNTVYINANTSAPNFNSNALNVSGNVQVGLQNNVFLNLSTATGTGVTCAYRRSTNALFTYALNSDKNIFYAGPNASNNLVYADPSNSFSSLFNFQNYVAPRESNSHKENTGFISTLGTAPAFLMVDPLLPSFTESGAQNIPGIADDFDSQIRQGNTGYSGTGTAPDIGSDEYNQALPPCSSVQSGTISPATATLCAGQNISLQSTGFTYSAAGGVQHLWKSSASASGPFAAVSGGSASNKTEYTSGALSSGTLYFVLSSTCSVNSQTSVSNQATVVILPAPSASISASSATLCSGNSIQLNLGTDTGVNFMWQGPSNFTSALQSPSLSNVQPASAGNYSVLVSAANGCSNSASYSLQVYPSVPAFSFVPAGPGICVGDSVFVSASVPVSSPTLVFTPQVNQNPSNGYPAPYSMYYGGQKMQFVIQASELFSTGFVAGSPVYGIEFPVVSLGTAWGNTILHCQDFQISMGHTTLNSITSFQSALQVVAPSVNFTPLPGFNQHVFSAPFIWDGQNNVIVETVFSNAIFGNASTSVIQYNSPTGFQSTVVYRADNQSFSAIATATAPNTLVSNARPDFKLNAVPVGNYIWTPAAGLASATSFSTQASPVATQVYTVVLNNGFCTQSNTVSIQVAMHPTLAVSATSTLLCVGNSVTLSASGADSYSWSNGAAQSQIAVSPAGNSTFVVTGWNVPCPSASAAVQVSVAPALLISAVSASPVLCSGETTTLYANGAATYTWSNGITGSSTTVMPLVTTTYSVWGSSGPGCQAQQTVSVVSNTLPLVQVSPPAATVCLGDAVEFFASGALTYTWLPINLSASSVLLIPQNSSQYTVTGQGINQCKSSVLVSVVVDPCLGDEEPIAEWSDLIQVYPNPSSDEFWLDFTTGEEKWLRVYSARGELVFEQITNEKQFQLSLNELTRGVYTLKVNFGRKEKNFKLLLQ